MKKTAKTLVYKGLRYKWRYLHTPADRPAVFVVEPGYEGLSGEYGDEIPVEDVTEWVSSTGEVLKKP